MSYYEENIPYNLHYYQLTQSKEDEENDSEEEEKNENLKNNNASIENEVTSNRSNSLNRNNDKNKFYFGEDLEDQVFLNKNPFLINLDPKN